MSQPQFNLVSPTTTTKLARIQSWQRGAHLQASEPHSPVTASSVSRRHSVSSPNSASFDVRVMPAPAVPQVQVHLAEPRPVLYRSESHVASLHSWDGQKEDLESRAGLRASDDQDERSTLARENTWRARAARMSRALFGPPHTTPTLTPWRALNVEKQLPLPTTSQSEHTVNVNVRSDSEAGAHKCSCKHTDPRRKRNRMCWCLLIILLILLAMVDIIFLNVRVLNPDFAIILPSASPVPTNLSRETSTVTATLVAPTATATSASSRSSILAVTSTISSSASASATPSVLQNCLTQFQINAPSSPSSFPCDTCFSALSSAPASANAGSAMQFCAMKAIFDSAGSSSSTNSGALSNAGWMKDSKPCGWNGIQCDSNGSIASIVLTFPGVPATIPAELSSVSTLTSLKITGDGNLPAGSLPTLNSLTTLDVENTGLSAFSDDAFSSTNSFVSLTLVRNSKMGPTLPSSIGSLSLKSLIVNGQSLTSFGPIFVSTSLASSLQTLDLSSNSITASLPSDLSRMSALAELNLSANDISAPFPSAMPSALQVLNLEGNTKLSGSLPSSMCSSTTLTQCDLKNTGFDSSTSCGTCTLA